MNEGPSNSLPEIPSVMGNIQKELEISQKNADMLYQLVCKFQVFTLECDGAVKASQPSDASPKNTHISLLKESCDKLRYINAKNIEIISQLQALI